MLHTPRRYFNLVTGARSVLAYVDVDKDLWLTPAPRDTRSRLHEIAARIGALEGIVVGGSSGATTARMDAYIQLLRADGVPPPKIGTFCADPGESPGSAGFVTCPILLNRSRAFRSFDWFLHAFPALTAANHHVIPYAYLLVSPAEQSAVARVTGAEVVDPATPGSLELYAALAQALGGIPLACESGSGASRPLGGAAVARIRRHFDGYLMIGGGISTGEQAAELFAAGADAVNVGHAFEAATSVAELLDDLCDAARTHRSV